MNSKKDTLAITKTKETDSLRAILSKNFNSTEIECYNHSQFGLKIAQYETIESAKIEIGKALMSVIELVGIRVENRPSLEAKKDIATFVYNTYKGICPEEIKLAFNLYFEGKLVLHTKEKDFNHYQSFSIPYLTTIINGYLDYKYQSINNITKHIEIKKDVKEFSIRLQKSDFTIKKLIVDTYNEIVSLEKPSYMFSFSSAYDFLDYIGMVDLTIEEKKEIMSSAKIKLIQQGIDESKKSDNKRIALEIQKKYQNQDPVSTAKHDAFIVQLNKYNTNGLEVEDLERTLDQCCYICRKTLLNIIELKRTINRK